MTRKILFAGYRSVITLAFPLLILYVLARGWKDRRYFRHLAERFGWLRLNRTRPGVTPFHQIPGGIWIHAVSVGEVMLVPALAEEFRRRWPERPVLVSVTTVAGREAAEKRLAGLVDALFYAPLDAVWIVRRVLRKLRPSCVVILETEIWPNLWREAKRFGASLYVVNGRISDRAFPAYSRWRWAFRHILPLADAILTQSPRDEERYLALGARGAPAIGNLKFDFRPPSGPAPEIAGWAGGAPLFIAASTMPPDEADLVIRAYRQMPDGVKMLLAPRKPELFDEAAAKLREAGIPFVRRSAGDLDPAAPVLLLDTIGELAGCFALPSVVFIGGSLVPWGGHNLLEPAIFGRAIVTGPHMHNFAAMAEDFRAAEAVRTASDPDSLAAIVRHLLEKPDEGAAIGARARNLAEARRGATARAAARIQLGAPLTHRPIPAFWQALSGLWRAGVGADRRLTRRVRLQKPVISVGGLAMGGSGKTPFTLWLVDALAAAGLRPAVLLRGYGRQDRTVRTFAPGAAAPFEQTGDEAQLYLRQGKAWVGIGRDRAAAAAAIASHVDLFLLDDGFQHWRLHRDFDIVLLDELDPHAGGGVFPAGLLREPPSALGRADAVITVRKRAADVVPAGAWEAFCGIGNPGSFLATLRAGRAHLVDFIRLGDHQAHLPAKIRHSSNIWLTTAKDAARFPELGDRLRVVPIRVELPDPAGLLERILRICGGKSDGRTA